MRKRYLSSWCLRCSVFIGLSAMLTPSMGWSAATRIDNHRHEQQEIKGTVRDEQGKPLQGVTVLPKSEPSAGTVTNAQGEFTLSLSSPDEIIVFRSIGYASQEVPVQECELQITLIASGDNLEEVVVVGYGTQKKESVTGAISSVGAEDLARSTAVTTSGALVGKIAGVNSRMPDGRPGGATSINIRNMGTPLYVIDGVQKDEGQFNNLDFNDIENISVLKDASAAIYGVRAANGVVVVTTKKGKRGDNNEFNINSYYGWQSMFRFPEPASRAPTLKVTFNPTRYWAYPIPNIHRRI